MAWRIDPWVDYHSFFPLFPPTKTFPRKTFPQIFSQAKLLSLFSEISLGSKGTIHNMTIAWTTCKLFCIFFKYCVHILFQSLRYKAISSAKLALFILSLRGRHIVLSISDSAWIYLLVFVVSLEEASGRSLICLAATLSPSDLAPDTLDQPPPPPRLSRTWPQCKSSWPPRLSRTRPRVNLVTNLDQNNHHLKTFLN